MPPERARMLMQSKVSMHVEDGVPSFAISLYKEYRGLGIGTMMMKQMLAELKVRGYQKTSLAVQKERMRNNERKYKCLWYGLWRVLLFWQNV